MGLNIGRNLGALAAMVAASALFAGAQENGLKDPPAAHGPVALSAVKNGDTGKLSFAYEGKNEAPTIRVSPGQTLHVDYTNNLPKTNDEKCVEMPCMDMTNLHFHGLHVSPNAPQDDVLTMMAKPGGTLHYDVQIPSTMPPGLYWYHTHPHGESYRQALDGMSGAIVVEGMEKFVPEVSTLRERILVLRSAELEPKFPGSAEKLAKVVVPGSHCGSENEKPERAFTLNGQLRPEIPIGEGERQFWRILNASPDLYADLAVDEGKFEIVALDGMPLGFHRPDKATRIASHVVIPPAGRVEAIVTGPPKGSHASLRSLCVSTGAEGDPNPEMVIADLAVGDAATEHAKVPKLIRGRAKLLPIAKIARIEKAAPDFTVVFTEDKNGFYINGQKFAIDAAPMLTVQTGGYQHWRVVNKSREVHPFHIHQIHFLAFAQNGKAMANQDWLDTVNVPVGGSVDLVMDFTDPIIRGMSLFHCHLLKHEDKGMMAKVLFK